MSIGDLVLGILAAMLAVMAVGWLVQRAAGNGGWVDIFWTYGTGLTCVAAALWPAADGIGRRQFLVAALVLLWSSRLGTYIALRVLQGPEDVRYATLRRDWGAALQPRLFWLMIVQAPATAILGVAILYAARQPDPAFRITDALGVLILLGAVAGESLADYQMKRFKADPAHHGLVCATGLWGWSRHPNYFFEALMWLAYPVIGFDPDNVWSLMAWLAPVLMIVVLRYGTGVPPLEKAMLQSKGEAYRHYQQRVSALLPLPPRR